MCAICFLLRIKWRKRRIYVYDGPFELDAMENTADEAL